MAVPESHTHLLWLESEAQLLALETRLRELCRGDEPPDEALLSEIKDARARSVAYFVSYMRELRAQATANKWRNIRRS